MLQNSGHSHGLVKWTVNSKKYRPDCIGKNIFYYKQKLLNKKNGIFSFLYRTKNDRNTTTRIFIFITFTQAMDFKRDFHPTPCRNFKFSRLVNRDCDYYPTPLLYNAKIIEKAVSTLKNICRKNIFLVEHPSPNLIDVTP